MNYLRKSRLPFLNSRKPAFTLLSVILVFLTIPLASYGKEEQIESLKIGVVLPLTGILAQMGQFERMGMDLATEEEQTVKLLYEDGKGDKKTVATAVTKLIEIDKVDGLITSTTGASLVTQPIADRAGVPLIAFCMGSDVAPASSLTIRYYTGIEEEASQLIAELKKLPPNARVGILHADEAVMRRTVENIYLPKLKDYFAIPPTVVEYNLQAKDFRAQLIALKNAQVKHLIILGYGFEYENMFNQLAQLKMRKSLSIYGGWGFLYTKVDPILLEGSIVAGPTYVFGHNAKALAFERRFLERYKILPNFDAAFAYEVIKNISRLMKLRQPNDQQSLKRGLAALGTVQGVVGNYRFDEQGNMIIETSVGVMRNGLITKP